MKKSVVLALIGPDRPGLVSAVAARASDAGANWLESRMARLAGQFAGVVRLEIDADSAEGLEAVLQGLAADGLHVMVERGLDDESPALRRVRLELVGHDRPGIVQEVSSVLLRHGITIDRLETDCERASMSGEALFRARADLGVPVSADLHAVQGDLEALANELMVDLELHDG